MKKNYTFIIIAILIILGIYGDDIFTFFGGTFSGRMQFRCSDNPDAWYCRTEYDLAKTNIINIGNYKIQFAVADSNNYYYEIDCRGPSSFSSEYSRTDGFWKICGSTELSYCDVKEIEKNITYEGQEYVDIGKLDKACPVYEYTHRFGHKRITAFGNVQCISYCTVAWQTGYLSKSSQTRKGQCWENLQVYKNGVKIHETPYNLMWRYNYKSSYEHWEDDFIEIYTLEDSSYEGGDTCNFVENEINILSPKLNPSYTKKADGSVDISIDYNWEISNTLTANITSTFDDDTQSSQLVTLSSANELINIPSNSEITKITADYLMKGSELSGLNGYCYNDIDQKQKGVSQYCDYVKIGGFSLNVEKEEEIVEEEEPAETRVITTEPTDIYVEEEVYEEYVTAEEEIVEEEEHTWQFYILLLCAVYFILLIQERKSKK